MTLNLLDAVRIEIGDTAEGPGILPGQRHFQDSELTYAAGTERVTAFTSQTDQDVGRTSAKCLEIAAAAWSSQPEEVELGPSIEKGKRHLALSKRASILRAIWGYGGSGRLAGRHGAPSYVGVGANILPPGLNS